MAPRFSNPASSAPAQTVHRNLPSLPAAGKANVNSKGIQQPPAKAAVSQVSNQPKSDRQAPSKANLQQAQQAVSQKINESASAQPKAAQQSSKLSSSAQISAKASARPLEQNARENGKNGEDKEVKEGKEIRASAKRQASASTAPLKQQSSVKDAQENKEQALKSSSSGQQDNTRNGQQDKARNIAPIATKNQPKEQDSKSQSIVPPKIQSNVNNQQRGINKQGKTAESQNIKSIPTSQRQALPLQKSNASNRSTNHHENTRKAQLREVLQKTLATIAKQQEVREEKKRAKRNHDPHRNLNFKSSLEQSRQVGVYQLVR